MTSPAPSRPVDDIPGTTIFCARSAQRAYELHRFCMSLMRADNRDAFRAGEAAWLQRFAMTDAQHRAVLARDYAGLVAEGGNIYFLVKIAGTDGWSVQRAVAAMAGMPQQDFAAMMLAGGRPPDGWRTRDGLGPDLPARGRLPALQAQEAGRRLPAQGC